MYKMEKYCIQVLLPESNEAKSKKLKPIQKRLNILNFCSLFFEFISSISLMFVGNFRSLEYMHIHSAVSVTTFVTLYISFAFVFYILYQLSFYSNINQPKPIILGVLIIIGAIGSFNCAFGGFINTFQVGDQLTDPKFRLGWNPSNEGYFWHVFSTVNEWIAINSFSFIFFYASRHIYLFQKHLNRISFFH